MTGWHGEQWDFQNNEKTMEHSDHRIWLDGMENSGIIKTIKRQWNTLITGSWLDGMENSEIFKTMKRQWNILITGSWLDGMENSEIFKTMKRQWNILIIGSWLDGMRNSGIFKTMKRQWTFRPLNRDWMAPVFGKRLFNSYRERFIPPKLCQVVCYSPIRQLQNTNLQWHICMPQESLSCRHQQQYPFNKKNSFLHNLMPYGTLFPRSGLNTFTWKESVNALPKVVGFPRVLRFPPTGNVDRVGWD
jgi:hypothetical protein